MLEAKYFISMQFKLHATTVFVTTVHGLHFLLLNGFILLTDWTMQQNTLRCGKPYYVNSRPGALRGKYAEHQYLKFSRQVHSRRI